MSGLKITATNMSASVMLNFRTNFVNQRRSNNLGKLLDRGQPALWLKTNKTAGSTFDTSLNAMLQRRINALIRGFIVFIDVEIFGPTPKTP